MSAIYNQRILNQRKLFLNNAGNLHAIGESVGPWRRDGYIRIGAKWRLYSTVKLSDCSDCLLFLYCISFNFSSFDNIFLDNPGIFRSCCNQICLTFRNEAGFNEILSLNIFPESSLHICNCNMLVFCKILLIEFRIACKHCIFCQCKCFALHAWKPAVKWCFITSLDHLEVIIRKSIFLEFIESFENCLFNFRQIDIRIGCDWYCKWACQFLGTISCRYPWGKLFVFYKDGIKGRFFGACKKLSQAVKSIWIFRVSLHRRKDHCQLRCLCKIILMI